MFSKHHYEAIARVLQAARDHAEYRASPEYRAAAIGQTVNIEQLLADMFARDNGQFNRDRFERACVPDANVKARTA